MELTGSKIRESNYELLRIVAMCFIVLYHMLIWFIAPVDETPIYRAMYLPLHVAVICFVLISGYFHIKPSLRGLVKVIAPLIVYYLPLSLIDYLTGRGGGVISLLFFTQSPYWFIRIYICLFLISPILNTYCVTNKRRLYLLIVLGFISVYMGTMQEISVFAGVMGETSLHDGKNLVLFMFLYVLGDCLRVYKNELLSIRTWVLVLLYLLLNAGIMVTWLNTTETIISKAVWRLSYPYCSPFLIINAVLLFLLFGRFEIKSKIINYCATSVFAVYIIHHQSFIKDSILAPIVTNIYNSCPRPFVLICSLFFFTLIILLCCFGIDKLFTPLWSFLNKSAGRIDDKIKKCWLFSVSGLK